MTDRDVILAGIVGSTAYGLSTDHSDVDTLGIYRATLNEILGLQGGPGERGAGTPDEQVPHIPAPAVNNSDVSHTPDITLHEVGKFVRLALKGNPTILELLYLDGYTVLTEEAEMLIGIRGQLVSEKAVRGAYGGYALQQARRLVNRRGEGKDGFGTVPVNRIAKHARHCGRLIHLGTELLATGSMNLDCSDIREDLFDLGRLAVGDEHGFLAEFERRMRAFDSTVSVLPATPDFELAENVLIAIRLYQW